MPLFSKVSAIALNFAFVSPSARIAITFLFAIIVLLTVKIECLHICCTLFNMLKIIMITDYLSNNFAPSIIILSH